MTERTHGKCVECKTRFELANAYVTYGGVVFCSEDCLAEWYVSNEDSPLMSELDYIIEKMEHRP